MEEEVKKKICSKCGDEKLLGEFCKNKSRKCGYDCYCKNCRVIIRKKHYDDNSEKLRKISNDYYYDNKEKSHNYVKNWRAKNVERHKIRSSEYNKNYYNNNKKLINKKKRIYEKKRLQNDVIYKLKQNITCLIKQNLKNNNYTKKSRTHEILGCTIEEFKQHLEKEFESWMNWKNHGKYKKDTFNYGWDLDHIIPVSSAKTYEDVIRLNHYTNFQPLCSKVNRDIKRDKI